MRIERGMSAVIEASADYLSVTGSGNALCLVHADEPQSRCFAAAQTDVGSAAREQAARIQTIKRPVTLPAPLIGSDCGQDCARWTSERPRVPSWATARTGRRPPDIQGRVVLHRRVWSMPREAARCPESLDRSPAYRGSGDSTARRRGIPVRRNGGRRRSTDAHCPGVNRYPQKQQQPAPRGAPAAPPP